jgi:hypothetical protein
MSKSTVKTRYLSNKINPFTFARYLKKIVMMKMSVAGRMMFL